MPRFRAIVTRLALTIIAVIPTALVAQSFTEFDIATSGAQPYWLAGAIDGSVWFTMPGARSIGRISTTGSMTAFGTVGQPLFLTALDNGDLWYTTFNSRTLGVVDSGGAMVANVRGSDDLTAIIEGITSDSRFVWTTTSSGTVAQLSAAFRTLVREASVPALGGPPPRLAGMTTASDGTIWFADARPGAPRLGWIELATSPGVSTLVFHFVALPADSNPFVLAPGDYGAVWYTDLRGSVGRVTRDGTVTRILMPTGHEPLGIARSGDGNIWFTESVANRLGRVDQATLTVAEIDSPTAFSQPAGIAAGRALCFAEHTANKIACSGIASGPDLSVSISGPDLVDGGDRDKSIPPIADVSIQIRNRGTETARGVRLNLTLAGTIHESTSSRDGCKHLEFEQGCTAGDIQPGDLVEVTIAQQLSPHEDRADTVAFVQTDSAETNLANNRDVLRTNVVYCASGDLVRDDCPLLALVGPSICKTSTPLAQRAVKALKGMVAALAADTAGVDLGVFYRLRDQVFARTAAGRRYTELYYTHGREIATILTTNASEGAQALDTVRAWQEPLRALVDGNGSSVTITAAEISSLQTLLNNLKRLGGAELRATIESEEAKLQLSSLAGQTMDDALARQSATAPATITLPAAASLHGLPPTFFHSDVRVFNPDLFNVPVTARYHCLSAACAGSTQTFTVRAGEMKVFNDMVAQQFVTPESGGAVEFDGDVVVDSRLYTPEAGSPTTGMNVPALSSSSAYAESVLLSLSYSADGSRGFRTNAGAYNPNDAPLDAVFTLFDRLGNELGHVTRSIPARTPVQVNNVFAAAGVTADVDAGYCVVRADGIHELFAYASVIDNKSQDLIFVVGQNRRRGALNKLTLPAAASLHGIPPSFFHSDVTVFNPSPSNTAHVIARFRCFSGSCGRESASLDIAPGEARVFEDAPVALFGAAESGGAIEFDGPVVVDSRLYTPSRPAPSTGMYIPASSDDDAHTDSVLLSLAHSADQSRGFRTNAGVYNPNPIALDVTFTLFDASGARLGEITRAVPALTPLQVNNIFAVAGVTVDVPSAYCVVRADGLHGLFAYASVIDNRSQDLTYVRGSRRRGM